MTDKPSEGALLLLVIGTFMTALGIGIRFGFWAGCLVVGAVALLLVVWGVSR